MTLLFGTKTESMDALSQLLSANLEIPLEKHDSLFYGGDYYCSVSGYLEITLQTNNDGGPPEEPAEGDFPDYPVLLYVTTHEKDWVCARLAKCGVEFILLRESN